MGHIRDLPKKKLGIEIVKSEKGIEFKPEYEIAIGKETKVLELKKIYGEADDVILATDPDREGEAIAWHVAALLRGNDHPSSIIHHPFSRVVFHQITKDAILEAMKHPREINMSLVDAQQARRILDRIVGYKLSPLLWKKIRRGLSAGRVQSVTVKLVVDREREIEAFVPQEFWEIFATCGAPRTIESATSRRESNSPKDKPVAFLLRRDKVSDTLQAFIIKLIEKNGEKIELSSQDQVDPIVTDLEIAKYLVKNVDRAEVRKRPFPPFTTSTLQQSASRVFRWSGRKTMSVAQRLYEHGFITYHRTDSTNLASEAVAAVRILIPERFSPEYQSESARIYKTKNALAQEAHEAIRPTKLTDIDRPAQIEQDIGLMGRDAARLYSLIWKRFVACQMADQIYDQTTIDVQADGQQKYLLRARGLVEKFDGWKKLYQGANIKSQSEAGEIDKEGQDLPDVKQGESLKLIKVDPKQNFTQPSARYTEAMLIKTLEEKGIGRPSTYAPIITTIQDRGYVEKQESRFLPLPVGVVVNDFLVAHFPQIVDYDFSREMEAKLDKIAQDQLEWNGVVGEFYLPFENQLEETDRNAERQKIPAEETGEACPRCGEGRQVIRSGKFGKFLSCSRFPECKWKAKLVEKLGMKCPECRTGDVVVKRTRKGKSFYGCSRYPDCNWASWRKPSGNEQRTKSNEQ